MRIRAYKQALRCVCVITPETAHSAQLPSAPLQAKQKSKTKHQNTKNRFPVIIGI